MDGAKPVAISAHGCKFADRCPYVMDICRAHAPPLFRLEERRAASCFLYQDRPVLEEADLDLVLATPVAAGA